MTRLLTAETDRATWLAARRQGIGASEIAAVLGISPWESPFSLYWRKLQGWEVEPTDEMRAGTRLEPVIADWWADECDPHENLVVRPAGLAAHHERPWQLATPDRVVQLRCASCDDGWAPPDSAGCHDCRNTGAGSPPLAVLECKYVAHSWDGWGDPDTDEIPVYYRAQVQWQCDVVDVDEWYLAALGPGGFRAYRGRRDEKDLRLMREAGRRFMVRIEDAAPPGLDEHAATLATMKRLHPDLDDRDVEVPPAVAAGYVRAVAMVRKAEILKDRYDIALRAHMGRARRATVDGRRVATHVISDIDERTQTVAAHRRDYLLPPRERKTP